MWFNIILRMPGAQTKGLTAVYYDNVQPGEEFVLPGIRFLMTLTSFSNSLPLRQSSMHFCLKTTKSSTGGGGGASHLSLNNSVLALLTNGFPQYTRVRMKIHFGSDMELLYQLQSYGIDLKTFPVDVRTGALKEDQILNKWYYDYHNRKQEATSSQPRRTETPNLAEINPIDILSSNADDPTVGDFDAVDLEKTLDTLMNDDDFNEPAVDMESKVLERRDVGGGEAGANHRRDASLW